MKKAYWVVSYRAIKDEAALQAYAQLAGPAIAASGGRVLVRAAASEAFEEGLKQRTVVIEFDSVGAAMAARETEAYRQALVALGAGVERDFRIVEGV